MTTVQQRIAAAGIARDAVRTLGYSIQQEFDFANGRRTPRGYLARNSIEVRLDERTRRATARFASTLTAAIEQGFLPAAPDKDACERCEFIAVCGPYEAQRVQGKDKKALEPLVQLRREP